MCSAYEPLSVSTSLHCQVAERHPAIALEVDVVSILWCLLLTVVTVLVILAAAIYLRILLDSRHLWAPSPVLTSWLSNVLWSAGHCCVSENTWWQPRRMAGLVHPGHDLCVRHVSPLPPASPLLH